MKASAFKLVACLFAVTAQAGTASADAWSDYQAKGKAEGVVVVATNVGLPAFREGLVNLFQAKYGIKVDLRIQQSSETDTILIRECNVNRSTIDVTIGGNGDQVYKAGCFAPVKPQLVMPEVVDGKNWRDGAMKFNDPKREYLLETTTSLYGWLIVNSDQVKDGDLVTSKDLLKPQYRGKIAAFDPRVGGAGQNMASYLYEILGDTYFKDLYVGQKIVYSRDYSQLSEWIARGNYTIGIGAVARATERFRKEGLPVKIIQLKDMAYTAGSVSIVRLTKGAPHPNAAAVFMNWFASKEGQELFSRAIAEPSRRTDVTDAHVPEYMVPKAGVKYFDTYEHEFNFEKHPFIKTKVVEILGR